MQAVATSHVWLDDRGVAWIDNTNTKVVEIALDKTGYGWGPEEMHEQHPYLSLSQLHAALAYYYDHEGEMDAEIERAGREIEALRAKIGETPFEKRVRKMGVLQ